MTRIDMRPEAPSIATERMTKNETEGKRTIGR